MKTTKKMKTISLALVALVLVAALNVGNALAYFTDFTQKTGEKQIDLGFTETELIEEIEPSKKVVKIKNTGDYPAYVRMIGFIGNGKSLAYTPSDGKWSKDHPWKESNQKHEYYYYSDILQPGETTSDIIITWSQPDDADTYNVIIIQEATPVLYDSDGNPYAAWDATMMDSNGGGPTSEVQGP